MTECLSTCIASGRHLLSVCTVAEALHTFPGRHARHTVLFSAETTQLRNPARAQAWEGPQTLPTPTPHTASLPRWAGGWGRLSRTGARVWRGRQAPEGTVTVTPRASPERV